MASGNLFFESDGVADNFNNNDENNQPENEFWERTQNQLDQLEKDFPDALNIDEKDDPFDLVDNQDVQLTNGTDKFNSFPNNLGDNDSTSFTTNTLQKPSDTISNASSGVSGDYSSISKIDKIYKEPESIRIWREKQQEILKIKDQEEEIKKKEMKEEAKKELEKWENMHKEQVAKAKENNRKQEKEFQQLNKEDTSKALERNVGNENIVRDQKTWEKVAKFCDFNPKNTTKHVKDITRLRSVIVKLKSPSSSHPGTNSPANSAKNGTLNNQSIPNGNIYDEEDE